MRKRKIDYRKRNLAAIKRATQARDSARLASGECEQRDMFLLRRELLQDAVVRSRTTKY